MTRINAEQLQKLHACQQGIDFIQEKYPDGVELIELINDPQVPNSFLHWGYQYIPASEEEVLEYFKRMVITDSVNVQFSRNVDKSKVVIKSKNVVASEYIYESSDVDFSSNIIGSSLVSGSRNIYKSELINKGTKLFKAIQSDHVGFAYNIIGCINSSNLYLCKYVEDSSWLIKCQDLINSHFCVQCADSKNLLLCSCFNTGNLHDDGNKYYIFNQEVTKSLFEMSLKQIQMITQTKQLQIFKEELNNEDISFELPEIQTDFRKLYDEETKKLIVNFAKNLRGYNGEKLTHILFDYEKKAE